MKIYLPFYFIHENKQKQRSDRKKEVTLIKLSVVKTTHIVVKQGKIVTDDKVTHLI